MFNSAGDCFVVNQNDLHDCQQLHQPLLKEADLNEGEALLAVDRVAFTANNITYAALGKRFQYWDFFPVAEPWGQIPVWGFADVIASKHPSITKGTRVYGYLPMAPQLKVQPGDLTDNAFTDKSSHRAHLALAYNQYQFTARDPAYRKETEALQMLLRPLLITSFLLDDYLAENDFFAADQIILTSASSKTALGLAFMLQHQRAKRDKPLTITALTSNSNLEFVRNLGYYDKVVSYDQIGDLDASQPSVSVDFAGNGTVLAQVHKHFADNLRFSSLVGAAHWDQRGAEKDLPGPAPQVFFAPGYWEARAKELGAAALMTRFASLWQPLVGSVSAWMDISELQGEQAIKQGYLNTLDGKVSPQQGVIMRM